MFPVESVYATIDGTADVPAHGMRDMPVWGARYQARIGADDRTIARTPEQQDVYARTRILARIEYLSSIQGN
ncbi:hypothetical protein [Rhodovulum sp. ES.010]|uniref:hypothetical protein n=1 Tax=Rhodovulum sp. ES.010 TaxID=1882821 RepID=UPI0009415CF2|nr:hypothetical protein [Rhodovulum sp. ES.010]